MGITLEHISYQYNKRGDVPQEYALKDISLDIQKGEYIAIVGCTGSGKSTLLQHINGLLLPLEGCYHCDGEDVYAKEYSMKKLRQKVALCFQYPEYQLFEENVLKDICYGPKNMGFNEKDAIEKARSAMRQVGLTEDLEDKSPFTLSGGQKRRVALAGILAMNPDYLILDEPVAGLDEPGKRQLFSLLEQLNQEEHITVILVSHDMDDVIAHAKRVIVLHNGQVVMDGNCKEVFSNKKMLEQSGLEIPRIVKFYQELTKRWGIPYVPEEQPVCVEELASIIIEHKKAKEGQTCSGK